MSHIRRIKKHIGWHYFEDPKHLVFVVAIILGGVFGVRYSIQAYPDVFKTELTAAKNHVEFTEPMVVNFSEPMMSGAYASKIYVSPEASISVSWESNSRTLTVKPENFWRPETEYTLIIPEGRSLMFTRVPDARVKFTTPAYPRATSIFPKDGAENVTLDIEEPLVVNFDKSTIPFFVDFKLEPAVPLAYENNAEKTQFKILPKEKLKEGEKYQLRIGMKYKDDTSGELQEVYTGSFTTLPPPPKTWEKDFATRLEQAKLYISAKITTGKYIDINLAGQILSIFENGRILDAYVISSGKASMPTPKGNFAIHNKADRVWSRKYGLYMPDWMAVAADGSFGIHELPEWPGGYKEGAAHLGIPVSHGCIRLGVGPAKRVYDWTEIGTPVVIY